MKKKLFERSFEHFLITVMRSSTLHLKSRFGMKWCNYKKTEFQWERTLKDNTHSNESNLFYTYIFTLSKTNSLKTNIKNRNYFRWLRKPKQQHLMTTTTQQISPASSKVHPSVSPLFAEDAQPRPNHPANIHHTLHIIRHYSCAAVDSSFSAGADQHQRQKWVERVRAAERPHSIGWHLQNAHVDVYRKADCSEIVCEKNRLYIPVRVRTLKVDSLIWLWDSMNYFDNRFGRALRYFSVCIDWKANKSVIIESQFLTAAHFKTLTVWINLNISINLFNTVFLWLVYGSLVFWKAID